jgi:hypothetical protein
MFFSVRFYDWIVGRSTQSRALVVCNHTLILHLTEQVIGTVTCPENRQLSVTFRSYANAMLMLR